MSRLDDYRTALLVAHADVRDDDVFAALDERSGDFGGFIIDHGLGPLWHARTGREEFHASRMLAEAMFLAQDQALSEIGVALDAAAIDHVVIKGAANRWLCYENPAVRACHDIDILVRPDDRVEAARALVDQGFAAVADDTGVGRDLVLSRSDVDVDLHWALLREGRLSTDPTEGMLARRRRVHDIWMQSPEDVLFTLLVHPAFRKHLAGWEMGLHRVTDLLEWLRGQAFDWPRVQAMLGENGVRVAAWATLRWVDLLAGKYAPEILRKMLADLEPGHSRRAWLDFWLQNDLPYRTSNARRMRMLGFSLFLHDAPADALRAAKARLVARRHSKADLGVFAELFVERAVDK